MFYRPNREIHRYLWALSKRGAISGAGGGAISGFDKMCTTVERKKFQTNPVRYG
jgi:hypothetical protein